MPKERLRSIIATVAAQRSVSGPGDLMATGDSIDRLEAVLAIEAELGIDFDEQELAGLRDFDDLDRAVEAKLAATATNPPPPATPAPAPSPPLAAVTPPPRAGLTAALLNAALRTYFRIHISGTHHLPTDQGCLLCANHSSHLDSLALLAAAGPQRPRLIFAAAKDYFFDRPRFAALLARTLPLIPWERGGNLGVMRSNLRHLQAGGAAGRILVFYPEGTRSPSGELQPFRDGLAFFATQSALPIVPAWIEGTHRALPKGRHWPRPGRLSVRFGAPIPPTRDPAGLAETVRTRLLELRPSRT